MISAFSLFRNGVKCNVWNLTSLYYIALIFTVMFILKHNSESPTKFPSLKHCSILDFTVKLYYIYSVHHRTKNIH